MNDHYSVFMSRRIGWPLIGALVQYFEVQLFIASLAGLFLARGLAR